MHKHHFETARVAIAFLIVAIMGMVFLVFNSNKIDIIEANNFNSFITLTTVGAGLLIGLLYLVNRPHPNEKKVSRKAVHKTVKESVKVKKRPSRK